MKRVRIVLAGALFVAGAHTAHAERPKPWPCVDRAITQLDDRISSAETVAHAAVDKCLGPEKAKWNAAYGEEMVERLMLTFYQQGVIRVLQERAEMRGPRR